jgi:hypothetical protein
MPGDISEWGCYWLLVSREIIDAAEYPMKHRTVPYNKEVFILRCPQKPYIKDIILFI